MGGGGSASQPGAENLPKPACRFTFSSCFHWGSLISVFCHGVCVVGSNVGIWGSALGVCARAGRVRRLCASCTLVCGGVHVGGGGPCWQGGSNVGPRWVHWAGCLVCVFEDSIHVVSCVGFCMILFESLFYLFQTAVSHLNEITTVCARPNLGVGGILASQITRPNSGGVPASQILASQLRVPTSRPNLASQLGGWRVPFGVFIKVLARGRPSPRPSLGGPASQRGPLGPRPNLASQPARPNLGGIGG